MLTLIMNIWLVVVFAVVKPSPKLTLKWLAASLSLAASYLALTGNFIGGRLMSDEVNSNAAGHAAALGLLLVVGICRSSGRWGWWFVAVPPLYVVYVSQSRGALTVLAVGLACFAILTFSGVKRIMVGLFGGVFLFILWGPLSTVISEGVLSARDASFVENETRLLMLRLSMDSITNHPFGIGYGKFLDLSRAQAGVALNTHNDWIRIGVEVGLPSLALLFFIVVSRVWVALDRNKSTIALKAAVLAGCTSWLFANVTTDLRLSLPVWICAGLLWGIARRSDPQPLPDDTEMPSSWRSRRPVSLVRSEPGPDAADAPGRRSILPSAGIPALARVQLGIREGR
jgi:hypothetical protein